MAGLPSQGPSGAPKLFQRSNITTTYTAPHLTEPHTQNLVHTHQPSSIAPTKKPSTPPLRSHHGHQHQHPFRHHHRHHHPRRRHRKARHPRSRSHAHGPHRRERQDRAPAERTCRAQSQDGRCQSQGCRLGAGIRPFEAEEGGLGAGEGGFEEGGYGVGDEGIGSKAGWRRVWACRVARRTPPRRFKREIN